MSFFFKMVDLQLVLLFIMLVGVILSKAKVMTLQTRKGIGDVLIDVMLPASVLSAFLNTDTITPDLMTNCVIVFFISIITEALAIIFGGVIFRRYPRDWRNIMHYGMIVSNTAYIGIPVAGTLFGTQGLLYSSLYFIPVEISMWTFALALFHRDPNVNAVRMVLSAPSADAVLAGLVLMLLKIRLPEFVCTAVNSLASCTTPVSMLVIGAILADADYRKMFSLPMIHFSLVRLIIFPLIIYIPMRLLQLDQLVIGVSLVMAAMPAAAATSILADKYGSDSEFAVQIVIVSTLLSIVTIPAITLLL